MQVVLSHRRRGSAAFFAPYIAALPPQPPCPWLLPPGELDAAFAKLGAAGAAELLWCTCSHSLSTVCRLDVVMSAYLHEKHTLAAYRPVLA